MSGQCRKAEMFTQLNILTKADSNSANRLAALVFGRHAFQAHAT
jgi:hypothetical protein